MTSEITRLAELEQAVIAAAVAWYHSDNSSDIEDMSEALEVAVDNLLRAREPQWMPALLADVQDGDTIRLPGLPGSERRVRVAGAPVFWLGRPYGRAERTITFTDGTAFTKPTTLPIEILRHPAEAEAKEMFS